MNRRSFFAVLAGVPVAVAGAVHAAAAAPEPDIDLDAVSKEIAEDLAWLSDSQRGAAARFNELGRQLASLELQVHELGHVPDVQVRWEVRDEHPGHVYRLLLK